MEEQEVPLFDYTAQQKRSAFADRGHVGHKRFNDFKYSQKEGAMTFLNDLQAEERDQVKELYDREFHMFETPPTVSAIIHEQDGPTCYTYSVASLLRETLLRLGVDKEHIPQHKDLVGRMQKAVADLQLDPSEGSTVGALRWVEKEYPEVKLREVKDFTEVVHILRTEKRPLATSFGLTISEWSAFMDFFKNEDTQSNTLNRKWLEKRIAGNPPWQQQKFGGRHSVLATGFKRETMNLKNSWGPDVGHNGYCQVEYDVIWNRSRQNRQEPEYEVKFWELKGKNEATHSIHDQQARPSQTGTAARGAKGKDADPKELRRRGSEVQFGFGRIANGFRPAVVAALETHKITCQSDGGMPLTPRGGDKAFCGVVHELEREAIEKVKAGAQRDCQKHNMKLPDFLADKVSSSQREALNEILMQAGPLEENDYMAQVLKDRETLEKVHCSSSSSSKEKEVAMPLHELASLCKAVYTLKEPESQLCADMAADWKRAKIVKQEGDASIHTAVFTNEKTKVAVVAFKGTDTNNLTDISNDLNKVFAGHSCHAELQQADKVVKEYQELGYSVMVTGHSLGGFIAEIVATRIGLPGAAFCGPNPRWQRGQKRHNGFVNINFHTDFLGNMFRLSSDDDKVIYCPDDGKMHHSIVTMLTFLESKKDWTNVNAYKAMCTSRGLETSD